MIKGKNYKGSGEVRRPKIGLALGAGAAKGFAHIGVLKALEEAGIDIDFVAGSSAGALVGGLYCSGITINELEDFALNIEYKDWIDLTIPKKGVIKGIKIENIIKKFTLNKNIEELEKIFLAVATNLSKSERHVFSEGPVYKAIRASIAVPGIFEPVQLENMSLVDGGVLDRVPISVLRELKPDIVIAVSLGFTDLREEEMNIFDIIIQSVELLTEQAMDSKDLDAEVVIEPDLKTIGLTRFDLSKEAIDIGYETTKENINDIKKQIKLYENKPTDLNR